MPNSSNFGGTYPEFPGAERVCRLRYMECSGTDRDPHHYWARGHVRDKRSGRVGVDDAVCADGCGPGGLTYRAGTVGKGHCGCWLETVHLGRWRRCDADREADLDPLVHTVQTVKMDNEERR